MAELRSQDYRDEHATSLYPFSDGSSLVSDTGIALDRAMVLDAVVYPIGGQARCGITALEVGNRLITVWIGDPGLARRASGSFDPLSPPDRIALADGYHRPAGMLLVDPVPLTAAQSWPAGMHSFRLGQAEFVASCTIPTPEVGVRGFLTEAGELVTGDVWWYGEHGVVIRDDGGPVRIDVVGDPLFTRRLCFPLGVFVTPRFIKTINNIPPGPDGNWQITVSDHSRPDTVLRIYPLGNNQLAIEAVGRSL